MGVSFDSEGLQKRVTEKARRVMLDRAAAAEAVVCPVHAQKGTVTIVEPEGGGVPTFTVAGCCPEFTAVLRAKVGGKPAPADEQPAGEVK